MTTKTNDTPSPPKLETLAVPIIREALETLEFARTEKGFRLLCRYGDSLPDDTVRPDYIFKHLGWVVERELVNAILPLLTRTQKRELQQACPTPGRTSKHLVARREISARTLNQLAAWGLTTSTGRRPSRHLSPLGEAVAEKLGNHSHRTSSAEVEYIRAKRLPESEADRREVSWSGAMMRAVVGGAVALALHSALDDKVDFQGILEVVVGGIVSQNGPTKDCMYRDPDGRRSPLGFFIVSYNPALENMPALADEMAAALPRSFCGHNTRRFLKELQDVHDLAAIRHRSTEEFFLLFERNLITFCDTRNLTYPEHLLKSVPV